MILNIIVILGTLGIAFAWASKARGYGFFSALVTLACVVTAGAIAFGLWETVVHAGLFPFAEGDGFFPRLLRDNAWGIGLVAPFVVSLLVLRLLADKLVDSNLNMSDNLNLVGGGLLGIVIGSMTMGVVTIGLGHMRVGTGLFGYKPRSPTTGEHDLRVAPVGARRQRDREPLRDDERGQLRDRHAHGAVPPRSAYLCGTHADDLRGRRPHDGAPERRRDRRELHDLGTLDELLTDEFQPAKRQQPLTIRGEDPEPGSDLVGYVLQFQAGAKETTGSVIVTAAQVQLLVEDEGAIRRLLPISLIERTESGSLAIARFRFDAEGTAAVSVGGSAESVFAFEFLVPPGLRAAAHARQGRSQGPRRFGSTPFTSVASRDESIRRGEFFENFGVTAAGSADVDVDTSESQVAERDDRGQFEGVRTTNTLPGRTRIQSSVARGRLQLDDENRILSGRAEFDENAFAPTDADRSLVVDQFATPEGTRLVQLQLAEQGRKSMFGRALDAAERVAQPYLRDENGVNYAPIGYILAEGGRTTISYDPQSPIRALSQIPALSSTRQQSLILIFAPDSGVTITGFVLGNKEVRNFGEEGLPIR